MNNLGIALIFIVNIQYAYSGTIQCTVNCNKANSGSSPAKSFPSDSLLSAPIIDGPSNIAESNRSPVGPPIDAGPRYKISSKPPKRGFAPLPPHIQACIDGKGGKNCHRYARINTDANRRRFLMKNRPSSSKTKFRFIQKQKNRSKSSSKPGQIPSKKLKANAEMSVSDSVNSLVNSLVKTLDTGTGDKLSIKSGKRTKKEGESSKSESNISSRQSSSSTAVVSFSPSKLSSSGKSSKHSQGERSRSRSNKRNMSMSSGIKKGSGGSALKMISGNLPSASQTKARIARKRLSKIISGSSGSGSATSQTLSGSTGASSVSGMTSAAGRASSVSGTTSAARRASSVSGMTSTAGRASSVSGMTSAARRAPSVSGMTSAARRAPSVSGMTSAAGRASSVSGLKSAAGRASSVSGMTSVAGRASSVSGLTSAAGRAQSATSDIQKYVDMHNEDGSKGMNQDDSKGFKNQDKNKIQKLEFEQKQNEVSMQDTQDKQTIQKIEIEIKQVDVSKPDEQKSTGRNKFREEDGSKGQNQDGSQGKNQDSSRGQNQDSSQGKNQDQDKRKSSWVIIGHTNTGSSSQNLGVSQSSATASHQPKQPSVSLNMHAAAKGVNPNIRNTAINLQLKNKQTIANQMRSSRPSQSIRNAAVTRQLKNQQTLANQMRSPRPLKRVPQPSKPINSRSMPVQGIASSLAHTTSGSTNMEILAALNSAARVQAIRPSKPLIQRPIVPVVDTKRPRPAFLDDFSGTSSKELKILKSALPSDPPGNGIQGCSCAQATSQTSKPQLIQATAKLAIVGDRNVLIAKMPRAKVVDADGKGDFHLEFPNLIIQPTLTEKIASPSELFGMNMNTGTGSTDDSDILVVAMLPKGSKLGSKMFKGSKKDLDFNTPFDADIGTQVSELNVNKPSATNLGIQLSDSNVNKPSATNLGIQLSDLTINKPSDDTNIGSKLSDLPINKPSDDTNIGSKLNDLSINKPSDTNTGAKVSDLPINKPSDTNTGAKVTVDTSKDDGKLKIKVHAKNVKDSTISAIKDNLSKIKSDRLSVDTSKDDGKLKIKIKADLKKTDDNPDTNVVKTVQSIGRDKDNSNSKLANYKKLKALAGQVKSERDLKLANYEKSKALAGQVKSERDSKLANYKKLKALAGQVKSVTPNVLSKKGSTNVMLTPGKPDVIMSEAKVLPSDPVTRVKIEKSKDDGKLKYKIKTQTGQGDNKAKTDIKLTIDKYGNITPDIQVEKQVGDKTISMERSSFVHTGNHVNTNQITVAGKQTDKYNNHEEDGDNTHTIRKGKEHDLSSGAASVSIGSDSSKTTKIAEAVKALTALQKLQATNQAIAGGSIRLKPTLPDTTYKLPVNGGSLNTLSEKLSQQINLKLKTNDVEVLSRKRLLSAVLGKQPLLTKVATSAPVAATASPNLEALCLLYLGAFIDSIGYAPFPGKCNKLVQCFYLGGKLQTVARDCPAGMFWDQKQLLCRPPDDVICLEDQCLIHGTRHYRRDGGCNCFYKCIEGISVPSCCPKGYRYDDDKECVRASGRDMCDDECETPSILTRQLAQTSCPSLPDPMNRYGYLAPQYGGLRIRACPSGTIYSENQCRCKSNMNGNGGLRGSARKQFRQCSAEFKINFDDGFKDISKGGLAFDYSHISLRRGKGVFVGNSKLYIWGFQSRYLGKTFAIRMKVKIKRGAGKYRPEPIISNCGPNGDSSVEIVVHRGKVIFKAKTSDNPEAVFITEDYDDDKWTDLTYYYDGNHFGGSCNGRPFRQRTGGNLEIRDNPMTIGLCTGQNGFHGEIDELEIYTACIPKDM